MADASIGAVVVGGSISAKAAAAIAKGVCVEPDTSGTWVKATGAGSAVKGISSEAATAAGKNISVVLIGGTEAVAGEALATPGTWLKCDADGFVVAADTDADNIIGYSLGIATAKNDVIPVFVCPGTYEV